MNIYLLGIIYRNRCCKLVGTDEFAKQIQEVL